MQLKLVREGAAGKEAQLICLVAAPEEPLECLPELSSSLAVVEVESWERDLTPWPAAGAYKQQAAYEGRAAETLDELLGEVLPRAEKSCGLAPASLALAGYSLAGLFALWAFCSSDAFVAAASGSGSLWYPGWLDWLRGREFAGEGRRVYASLGTKESRVRNPMVAQVGSATAQTLELLEGRGVSCTFESNPGGHFTDIAGRLAKALVAIDQV
ncbi:MAG: alpha/beta hydrolase-fold protein [Coriobacteriales bacterium]|nr:alpha/beta hydrolase-fold protein [Coriobacteriales bacterium]